MINRAENVALASLGILAVLPKNSNEMTNLSTDEKIALVRTGRLIASP